MCRDSRARTRNTLLDPSLRSTRGIGSARGHTNPTRALTRPPAQTFSHLIGWVLTLAGVVGFFYCASFSTGAHTAREDVFGILSVNGWHNVVHLLTGLAGLWASRSWSTARTY